jgi:ribosomal protein L3 glutamine methyltransferase
MAKQRGGLAGGFGRMKSAATRTKIGGVGRKPDRVGSVREPRMQRPPELFTILDHVRYAVTQFTAAKLVFAHGTIDPVAEAAFLVCEALHLPPDQFEPFATARVAPHEQARIFDLIEARIGTRKPAAYLVNKAWLRGIAFYVDERVIVPRSYLGEILDGDLLTGGEESGLIADLAAVTRVLDLCTGCGCLAVLAAARFRDATIDAVDISADALEVAARNIATHDLADRIRLLHGDLFAPLVGERYDLIITNPPYVDAAGMAALPPENRQEPALALDGGPDGIAIVRRIIENAGQHLTRNGGLLCEVGRDRPVLEAHYPDAGFLWLDTEESSGEVFWLEASQLM